MTRRSYQAQIAEQEITGLAFGVARLARAIDPAVAVRTGICAVSDQF